MLGDIHIGTSGWSYGHWKELFYPAGLPATRWLPFYSGIFPTTEINSSFYRLPSIATVEKWVSQVPEDFIFCPKMSRYLTHMKKLQAPEEPLERFFEVFAPMRRQMGPVLVQLPPMLPFHYDTAAHFYGLLRRRYAGYAFVMEVRHKSWFSDDSLTLMAGSDIGLVIAQSGNEFPYSEMVTATTVYVRFHGPGALYTSSYNDALLERFAGKFNDWMQDGHEIWVYFNNDIHGYAVEDAQRLMQIMGKKKEQ